MTGIKPAEVSEVLKKQLEGIKSTEELEEVGTVLQVGDGIARIYGLNNVQSNELIEFDNGVLAIPSPTWSTVPTSSSSSVDFIPSSC
ncbi:MAG TPA: hypothetical protein ENI20_12485, partial [Bacteroides sp.]|nr:hypothetical protein [Bacteroides sp.]